MGPCPRHFLSEIKYYIFFVDDLSRFTLLFPLKHKSQVLSFVLFKQTMENLLGHSIKKFHTNYAAEYIYIYR
jgi:hypothetical protein